MAAAGWLVLLIAVFRAVAAVLAINRVKAGSAPQPELQCRGYGVSRRGSQGTAGGELLQQLSGLTRSVVLGEVGLDASGIVPVRRRVEHPPNGGADLMPRTAVMIVSVRSPVTGFAVNATPAACAGTMACTSTAMSGPGPPSPRSA
jgi:hypothetical protein